MNYLYYKPKGFLADYVKLIWCLDFNDYSNSYNCNKLIPSGCIEVLFHFGSQPFDKLDGNLSKQPRGLIIGQKSKFTEYFPVGKAGIVSAMLLPEKATSVIGIPLNHLSNQHIDVVDIFGKAGAEVIEKINTIDSLKEKMGIVEKFLSDRVAEFYTNTDKQITESVRQINLYGGNIKIESLAKNVNLSKRQLERKFSTKIGLSPKDFSRIIRFQKTLFVKQKNESLSLTKLAYGCGYSDQAHLIHDFKSISGLTPTEYFSVIDSFSDYYSF